MSNFFGCGFLRATILNGSKLYHSHVLLNNIYNDILEQFRESGMKIPVKSQFNRHFKEFITFIRKKKIFSSELKGDYIKHFSNETWVRLKREEKNKHSFSNCEEFIVQYKFMQHTFPIKQRSINIRKNAVLQDITNVNRTQENIISNTSIQTPNELVFTTSIPITGKQSLSYQKEAAKIVYNDMYHNWGKIYETPLTKILTKIPSINLTEKQSSDDKEKDL